MLTRSASAMCKGRRVKGNSTGMEVRIVSSMAVGPDRSGGEDKAGTIIVRLAGEEGATGSGGWVWAACDSKAGVGAELAWAVKAVESTSLTRGSTTRVNGPI